MDSLQTSNPQAASSSNLQQPGGNDLQSAASQSVAGINILDSSGQSIPLNQVTSSVAVPAKQVSQPVASTTNFWLIGGIGLIVVVFLAILTRQLFRQG